MWGGYTANAAPATNPAGEGLGVAVGTSSNAPKAENVAIGKGATISYSNGASAATGDIVVGSGANINNYASQGGSIAIGKNAKIENMAGGGEATFALGQTTFSGSFFSSARIPQDPTKVVGSIAIGDNTFARTGSTMIGSHNYRGALGDTTVDSAATRASNLTVYATTIGANSFSNGAFTTTTGVYNIISGEYNGGRLANGQKNFGATVTGALNSVESMNSAGSGYYSGIANGVVGIANRTQNSNGALVFGSGNEITNSIDDISGLPDGLFSTNPTSAKDLADILREAVRNSNGGGATLAIGGGNTADYTQASQMIGVNNTLKGTAANKATYSLLNGYKNAATNVAHVSVIGSENVVNDTKNAIVLGDKRKLTGANGSIILGSSDTVMETKVTDAAILGHNANVTVAGGVALGAKSVATTDKGVAGYDPFTKAASTDTSSATWTSTATAVSVGDAANNITRQITNVAAGKEDTDAVNVAQLKNAVTEAKTTIEAGENVTVAAGTTANSYKISAKDTTLKADTNALKLTGKTLSLNIEDTSGKKVTGSVDLTAVAGEIDTNTTYTMTGVENADNTTTITLTGSDGVKNEVKVASKDTRSTVKAGENVTITDKNNEFGAKEYTINVKTDGKVESGNTGIVSGGTVYNETHVKNDGTYVKKGNSAGDNLSVLDKQVNQNTTNITNLQNDITNVTNGLNKGLDFAGDKGTTNRKMGEKLTVTGGATGELTEGNIGVEAKDGTLTLKLAKDIKGLENVEAKTFKAGDTTINNNGVEIKDGLSLKKDGLNMAGKKITQVADGEISDTSKDAVNGSQLKKVKDRVEQNATNITNLKNDITNITNGVNKGLDFAGDKGTTNRKMGEKLTVTGGATGELTEGNIGVEAKDGKLTLKLAKDIKGLDNVEAKTFKAGDTTINNEGMTINNGPTITKNKVDMHNIAINNVGDGKVEEGSKDAINGGQVYNIQKNLKNEINNNTQNIYNMNNAIGELGERINKVGAGAAALAGLHPLDFDPEDKWDIAAGFGNYRNASAAAVGLFYRPNERTMLNVGFTMGDSRNMINAGVSVKLGRGDVYTKYSKVEMANRIEEQNKEIAALKAKDAERDAQMKEVLKQLEELRKGK